MCRLVHVLTLGGKTCSSSAIRLHRYFKPKKCGALKCSKEALELYKSDAGRATLAIHVTCSPRAEQFS